MCARRVEYTSVEDIVHYISGCGNEVFGVGN